MKSILFTELASDFIIKGLGLHSEDQARYVGKLGRHEVELVASANALSGLTEEQTQIVYLGNAPVGPYRAGDVLMAGSDDLLDRAFRALDEMEQRGVVVAISGVPDSNQVSVDKEALSEQVKEWREKKIPYICLFMAEPVNAEGQAKLITLARKVMS